jgi:hypothetical protein
VKIAAIPWQANGKNLLNAPKDSLYRVGIQMLVNDNSTDAQFAHYFRTAKSLLLGRRRNPERSEGTAGLPRFLLICVIRVYPW